MLFESANFIKPYLSTDKFLTILYPNGKRFVTLNAIQNKKIALDGKKVSAYQEGQVPNTMAFLTEIDAQAAFQLLTDAIETLKANGNTGGGSPSPGTSGVIRLPKDSSVTIADVGKLVMQKSGFINYPPQSIDDIDTKIFVADTSPATAGEKGIWEIRFQHDPPLEPKPMTIRVEFLQIPLVGMQINFINGSSLGYLTFFDIGSNAIESDGQIEVGTTIAETIANVVSYFAHQTTTLTQNVSIASTSTYIDFTFYLANDNIQYTNTSTIQLLDGADSNYFTVTTIQDLTPDRVSVAQNIYSAVQSNSYVIDASTWDSSQIGQTILSYYDLFANGSSNPYGTIGPYNIRYYSDFEVWIDAINWCFSNGSQGSTAFAEMFDIVLSLRERVSSPPDIYMYIQSKTAPTGTNSSSNFGVGGYNSWVPAAVSTQHSPVIRLPERIASTIVGVLVGVDGTDALISDGQFAKIKMASALDGANGAIPFTEEIPAYPWVVAWRNGTVLDFYGFINVMQNAGFSSQAVHQWLLIDGLYTPVTAAFPDGDILVKKGAFRFFGT